MVGKWLDSVVRGVDMAGRRGVSSIRTINLSEGNKKPRTYPEGRRCVECDERLSIYNSGPLCNGCQRKVEDAFARQNYVRMRVYLGTAHEKLDDFEELNHDSSSLS